MWNLGSWARPTWTALALLAGGVMGPLVTRAASGIPEFDDSMEKAKTKMPTHSLVSIDDVGLATAFLAHNAPRDS
jgi:enoyl-[acyl-carrier-protein] reductase (NADH)